MALERLLFGDISPGGKLPLTFPKTLSDTIQISSDLEVTFNEGLFVGYKWYDAHNIEPMFPFGHGLSYSTFELSDLVVEYGKFNTTSYKPETVVCVADLTNTGDVTATEVVQIYVAYPVEAMEPPKLLKAFTKVEIEAGTAMTVNLEIFLVDLRIWSQDEESWTLIHGEYTFLAGLSSRDIRSTASMTL